MEKSKFIEIFDAWLKKHNHDGIFYKNEKGWFILDRCKKTYLPYLFANYQQLLTEQTNAGEKTP